VSTLQGKTILIIDDDPDICYLVELALSSQGARVHSAPDGDAGLLTFETAQPDLVLLDIMMPGLDGLEVCTRILSQAYIPIIFLTVLGMEAEIIRGLDYGAIDYITKPFSLKVLQARVRAALRQAEVLPASEVCPTYSDVYLTIDTEKRKVLVEGERVPLTPTEYRLLVHLLQNTGRTVPFQGILHHVWGDEYDDSANYVHVYVSRLRRKLERDPKHPAYLHTEHGVGYRFTAASSSGDDVTPE
jgi:two-component system KDP operon response regulator KdpE